MQTAKEVTTHQPTSREPQPMSIALSNALARASNALGAGSLSTETFPSGARVGLETRMRELTAALELPRPDRVRAIVIGLGTMPSRTEDDPQKQRFILDQFVSICSDVPEWALSWAAMAFLKNDAGSTFRPTAGELRALAMRRVEGVRAERDRVNAVLHAKLAPPSKPLAPEDRKRLGDMLRNAARGFEDRP